MHAAWPRSRPVAFALCELSSYTVLAPVALQRKAISGCVAMYYIKIFGDIVAVLNERAAAIAAMLQKDRRRFGGVKVEQTTGLRC